MVVAELLQLLVRLTHHLNLHLHLLVLIGYLVERWRRLRLPGSIGTVARPLVQIAMLVVVIHIMALVDAVRLLALLMGVLLKLLDRV